MTATTLPTLPAPPPRRSAGRALAFALPALISAILGVGLLVAGGAAVYVDQERDDSGYVESDPHRLATPTAALVSDDLDIDLDGAEVLTTPDGLGRMRVEARAADDRPVFVGVARTRDVDALLRDVSHTTVTDVDFEPFAADYRDAPGRRRAAPPAGSDIWAASAQGQGAQTMTWDARDGDWSVVVMNADGTGGVDVDVRAGVKVPGWVATVGWSLLGAGIVVLLGAVALIVLAGRRSR